MDKTEVKKYVGQKVRAFRLHLKLSQFVLGEKAGINQRQIAQIECGKSLPSLNTLIKFSEIFQCQIGDFFQPEILKTDSELIQEINDIVETFDSSQLIFIHSYLKQFSMLQLKK